MFQNYSIYHSYKPIIVRTEYHSEHHRYKPIRVHAKYHSVYHSYKPIMVRIENITVFIIEMNPSWYIPISQCIHHGGGPVG